MFCKNCGEEIDDKAVVCPMCGVPVSNQISERAGKVNGCGIAGFVLSLVSLGLGIYFAIASILGLVLSIAGMASIKRCKSANGLAVAGLVLGIISTLIWGIIWLAIFAGLNCVNVPVEPYTL